MVEPVDAQLRGHDSGGAGIARGGSRGLRESMVSWPIGGGRGSAAIALWEVPSVGGAASPSATIKKGLRKPHIVAGAKELASRYWALAPLLALMAVGGWLRWQDRWASHPGDTDVILSITYHMLIWPYFNYYHLYQPQNWVYNHLPVFPAMVAPFYWLFENVLDVPKELSVKVITWAADLAVGVILYRQSRGGWRSMWGLLTAGVWLLMPEVIQADDHGISPAVAFALAGFANLHNGWLCGLLLALGVGTRSEIAFLALPVAFHFLRWRRPSERTSFLLAFGLAMAVILLPPLLYDPSALDYAMRRQLQRDAANQMSTLLLLAMPYLGEQATAFLRQNPSVLAVALTAMLSLLALRDRRVLRVLLAVAAGYLLTLPVVQGRYMLFAFGAGLFYAARYLDPLVLAAAMAMTWPRTPYMYQSWAVLLLLPGLLSILRPERTVEPMDDDHRTAPAAAPPTRP